MTADGNTSHPRRAGATDGSGAESGHSIAEARRTRRERLFFVSLTGANRPKVVGQLCEIGSIKRPVKRLVKINKNVGRQR